MAFATYTHALRDGTIITLGVMGVQFLFITCLLGKFQAELSAFRNCAHIFPACIVHMKYKTSMVLFFPQVVSIFHNLYTK
jgi:hypothetical protein